MLKKRRSNNLLVAIDVGSTKTCAAAATLTEDAVDVTAFVVNPTKGIRKGLIVDIEAVASSIREAIENLQEKISEPIVNAVVGIPASHIKIIESSGLSHVKKGEVTDADISKSIESALSVATSASLERLHVIPQEFIIDGIGGIKSPIGMSGTRLESKVAIVSADIRVVNNILKACQRADLDVHCLVLQSLACAESVLSEEDREKGVVLIDIGGGKTEVSVFIQGALRWVAFIPIGGNHFTYDMVIGLKLPFSEAERIKKVADLSSDAQMEIEAIGMEGNLRTISVAEIKNILYPRSEELFLLIKRELENCSSEEPLLYAAISGGGSQIEGLNHVAEDVLGLPVRTRLPYIRENLYNLHRQHMNVSITIDELKQPEYAVLVGLLLYSADRILSVSGGIKSGVFGRLIRGISGFLYRR